MRRRRLRTETRRLGAGDPLLQVGGDASRGNASGLAQLPVVGVLVPVNLNEAEDVLGDGANAVVTKVETGHMSEDRLGREGRMTYESP